MISVAQAIARRYVVVAALGWRRSGSPTVTADAGRRRAGTGLGENVQQDRSSGSRGAVAMAPRAACNLTDHTPELVTAEKEKGELYYDGNAGLGRDTVM